MTTRSAASAPIVVGSRVVTGIGAAARKGVVAFIGETSFATGEWVGVLLDTPDGKNDGSVSGVRYFEAEPNHGLFVKRAQLKIDKDAAPSTAPATASSSTTTSTISTRSSSLLEKRRAAAAGATAAATETRAPVEKEDDIPPPPPPSDVPSTSEPPPPTSPTRSSLIPSLTTFPATAASTSLSSSSSSSSSSTSSPLPTTASPDNLIYTLTAEVSRLKAELANANQAESQSLTIGTLKQTLEEERKLSVLANQKVTTLNEQIEKLKLDASTKEQALTKQISQLKATHEEEKNVLLEKLATANKIASQPPPAPAPAPAPAPTPPPAPATQVVDDTRIASLEAQIQELNDAVEMLTLDKEQFVIDLELSEEKNAQLANEVASLKAQIQAAASSDENATKLISLTEENEKLREALRRLHATSISEREAAKKDLDEALSALEAATASASEVDELRQYKINTEQQLNDLKQAVDAAASYEAMVEALTEKNLSLQQKVQVLESTVSDLEATAELNEELDASQREEITALRRAADSATVNALNADMERKAALARCDELTANMDKFRRATAALKEEKDSLLQRLAEADNELESKGLRVREASLIRSSHVSTLSALEAARKQVQQQRIQLLECKLSIGRWTGIFGSCSLAQKENEFMGMETALATAASKVSLVCDRVCSRVASLPLQLTTTTLSSSSAPSTSSESKLPASWSKSKDLAMTIFGMLRVSNVLWHAALEATLHGPGGAGLEALSLTDHIEAAEFTCETMQAHVKSLLSMNSDGLTSSPSVDAGSSVLESTISTAERLLQRLLTVGGLTTEWDTSVQVPICHVLAQIPFLVRAVVVLSVGIEVGSHNHTEDKNAEVSGDEINTHSLRRSLCMELQALVPSLFSSSSPDALDFPLSASSSSSTPSISSLFSPSSSHEIKVGSIDCALTCRNALYRATDTLLKGLMNSTKEANDVESISLLKTALGHVRSAVTSLSPTHLITSSVEATPGSGVSLVDVVSDYSVIWKWMIDGARDGGKEGGMSEVAWQGRIAISKEALTAWENSHMQSLTHSQTLASINRQLQEKSDELRAAIAARDEANNLLAAHEKKDKEKENATILSLREEVKMLNEALVVLEAKCATLEKQSRAVGAAAGIAGNAGGKDGVKDAGRAAQGGASGNSAGSGSGSIEGGEQTLRNLNRLRLLWRGLATHSLTHSLRPLPLLSHDNHRLHMNESNNRTSSSSAIDKQATPLSADKISGAKAVYRDARIARASIRIKSFDSSSTSSSSSPPFASSSTKSRLLTLDECQQLLNIRVM